MTPRKFPGIPNSYVPNHQEPSMFKEFDATELYCPKCRQAVPVRKRLLLIMPDGDHYEYLCAHCSESVGTKIDRQTADRSLIL